jgi:hypothetical protein
VNPALRYLKTRFPKAEATQVSLEKDVDLVTRDGIRLRSAHLLLKELV